MEHVVVFYQQTFQLTVPSIIMKMYPKVNFLLPTSDSKYELVYHSNCNFDVAMLTRNMSLVFLKYLRTYLTVSRVLIDLGLD